MENAKIPLRNTNIFYSSQRNVEFKYYELAKSIWLPFLRMQQSIKYTIKDDFFMEEDTS
jgi:hypothetical protein